MITKERLQELIKQGATIWCIVKFLDIYYEKPQKIIPITLNNTYNISVNHNRPFLYQKTYIFYKVCDIDNCYETEEDALWELEMSATRIEILSLPNYKVAKTYIDTDKFILEDNSKFKFLLLSNPDNIIIVDKQHGNQIFNKPLTKDNYIEACKLCLKLFKGESSRS